MILPFKKMLKKKLFPLIQINEYKLQMNSIKQNNYCKKLNWLNSKCQKRSTIYIEISSLQGKTVVMKIIYVVEDFLMSMC